MKRVFLAVFLTLIMTPSSNASLWNRRQKSAQTNAGAAETAPKKPIPVSGIKPDKKQAGALSTDGGDLQSGPSTAPSGPIRFGAPVEMTLTRAASRVFDLRSLPQTPPEKFERPEHEEPTLNRGTVTGIFAPPGPSPFIPSIPSRNVPAQPTIQNFDGLNFALNGAGHPPDTNGDVGPNHYIQTINTSIGIYQKNGTPIATFTFNTFMSQGAFGNLCDTNNFGDPVVLYDTFEDRWIITDFAFQLSGGNVVNPPGSFQCIAASKTGDPVSGGWNFYSINTANGLGDYPKFGIWPDGLYMTSNMFSYLSGGAFQTARAYAFNKAQMYAGKPSVQVVNFDIPGGDFTVIPSNARLQAGAPPIGAPNYFVSSWFYTNALTVYKFHVNWNNLALSTFTGPDTPLAATSWPNASVAFANSLGGNNLDVLQIRAMVQNQYSNIGGAESLWLSHTVRRFDTNGLAAPRWYQVDVTGGTVNANIPQAATWDPDNANVISRFMPSVAVDRAGNMALGYSTSNSTTKPAIKYAGRLSTDPPNTLGQTEQVLVQGTGTQTGNCGGTCTRWGDYSAMSLDPNGCTFWYTNMYYNVDGLNHLTRIGSFQFPACTPVGAGGTITGTVTANPGGAPLSGATIKLGVRTVTTNSSGVYSFLGIPAGAYPTLTATLPGYASGSASSIVVTDAGTTTQNFSLTATPASACLTDTTQADFMAGVATNTDVATSPNDAILSKPSLDQFNTNVTNSGFGFNSTTWVAQTFTPAVSGLLVKADLDLFCSNCSGTPQNLTVSVRATSGGLPTGADLASATIPGFLSGAGVYYSVTFGSPASVTAGTTYALVVRPNTNPTAGTYAVNRSVINSGTFGVNVYPGGALVASGNSGATWATQTSGGVSYDVGFHTFIDSGYSPAGDLISSVKDAHPAIGQSPSWSTLSWTATTPGGTSVQFQVAGSNSEGGPFNFIGPDGTASTFYTTSGASLSQFNGFRYLEYKAFLATSNPAVTPTLSDVTACLADASCASPAPPITPAPATVCGGSAGNTAAGPGGMVNYTWSVTNGIITGGINSQTVTYTAGATGTADLMLTVTDGTGCVKSNTISVPITPNPPPAITPTPAAVCANAASNTASGPAGATSYAWSIVNGTITSGTNTQTITYTAGASGTVGLTLVMTNAGGCTNTNTVNVTINPLPPTPNISGTLTFCTGSSTTLTSDSATGNQWYLGGNSIVGETNQTYVATAAGSYTVKVTDGNGCNSAMSTAAVVSQVSPPPTPTIAGTTNGTGTQDQACPEQPLTLTATSSGATSFQWYQDNNTLNGQTSSTYQATSVGTYYVTATANGCTSAQSAGYVVQNPTPHSPFVSFRNQNSSVTTLAICQGSSQIIDSDSATGIQWWKDNVDLGPGSQSLTVTQAGVYTAQLNALGCHSQFGRSVTITVDTMPPTPNIIGDTNGTGTQDQACPEQPLTLHANGATGATSYTWYSDNAIIPNQSTSTLVMTGVGNISVTATNGTCTTPHSATYVVQNPTPHSPFITFRGQNSSVTTLAVCGTSQIIDSDSATGIQWYKDGVAIPGAGSQSYTATQSGVYTAQLNALGCHSQFGRNVTLTINPLPATPTATPGGATTFCAGGSVTLTSNTASGNQWYLNGNPIGGATNQTYPATASGSYTVKVTDGNSCTSAASNAVVVTVNPTPATPTISGGPTTFCAGGSVTLTSSSASGNQWYLNGNPIGGQTNQTYIANASGSYTVVVTASGCSSAPSAATIVTVNPNPNATITAPASAVTGSNGNIASVANAGAGATYNWSITNGTITAGTGTNSITFTAGAVGTLTLNVTVTTSANCSDTKSANVTVVVPPVTVTSVSPTGGTIAGGSSVTINGTGFPSGATATFGGSAATNVVVVSAVKITARTPAHALGAVNVTVTNVDTSNGTLTSGYTYKAQQFDPNNDGTVTASDIFFLVNYLFLGGPAPSGAAGVLSGDANGDGVVNASDIFFLVNYLFLGGPRPNAVPTLTPVTQSTGATETPAIGGSISLGKPMLRTNHYVVPVIMTIRPDSITPQSMALRVHFDSTGNVGDLSVHKAGAAKDLAVPFEINRSMGSDLSYLVSYGGLNLGPSRSAVVAEIEIGSAEGAIDISIDPQLTMLGDQAGQMAATVANGELQVSGATIGKLPLKPKPHTPGNKVN